jgi:nucleoside-diphosphate-sugar epimerase
MKSPLRSSADAAIDCRAHLAATRKTPSLPYRRHPVVISSMDVYRAFGAVNEDRETDPVPLDEDSPVRPNRYPYRGKRDGMDDYDKLDVEDVYLPRGATSLRLPMVYGEHDYQLREEFILRRVRAGRTRIPFGAGTWLTCRGYVRDVARGARLVLESSVALGEALNLCEDSTFSVARRPQSSRPPAPRSYWFAWPTMCARKTSGDGHVGSTSSPAPRDRRCLGGRPPRSAAALRVTVAWHLANPPPDPNTDLADDRALGGAPGEGIANLILLHGRRCGRLTRSRRGGPFERAAIRIPQLSRFWFGSPLFGRLAGVHLRERSPVLHRRGMANAVGCQDVFTPAA